MRNRMIETGKGAGTATSAGCRRPEDLPKEALDYVRYIEEKVGCRVKYVSVGAEREEYVVLD